MTAAAAAAALVLSSGCGGDARQDAGDDDATFRVSTPRGTFPAQQSLAEDAEMRITVRNEDDRTIPNLTATLENAREGTESVAFGLLSDAKGVASRSRPAWVVEDGPLSGDTAYANTWALGPLAAGERKTFIWRVTAVRAGRYVLRYRLAGSLNGGAKLETPAGTVPRGRFVVDVDARPGRTRVTEDGQIVRVPGRETRRSTG